MSKLYRDTQLNIRLTAEEKDLFFKKMRLARQRNLSHFIRKCVLEKEIYVVDLEPFRKIEGKLGNIAGNINQIAKHTNTTGLIYRNDIEEIKRQIEGISRDVLRIYSLLLKRTRPENEPEPGAVAKNNDTQT